MFLKYIYPKHAAQILEDEFNLTVIHDNGEIFEIEPKENTPLDDALIASIEDRLNADLKPMLIRIDRDTEAFLQDTFSGWAEDIDFEPDGGEGATHTSENVVVEIDYDSILGGTQPQVFASVKEKLTDGELNAEDLRYLHSKESESDQPRQRILSYLENRIAELTDT